MTLLKMMNERVINTLLMSQKEKFLWYYRRLCLMSFAEIGYRLKNSVQSQVEKFGLFTAHHPPSVELSKTSRTFFVSLEGIVDQQPYFTSAEEILKGQWRIFSLNDAALGQIPNWNQNPDTKIIAPVTFGKTLNYRDPKLVGDAKYLWELNRHLHLVTLAQAYALSEDERYIHALKRFLASWFQQCSYLKGPNWTSALELSIRLINWAMVWQLIGGLDAPVFSGEEGKQFLNDWLTSVYQHAHFIKGHFSRYSSANNHLIGEAAGLFVTTVIWPYWNEFSKWRLKAQNILVEEALQQNAPDGGNREHAISYQQFVLDFLLIAALAGRTCKIEFPKAYWDRIEAMLEYLASLMDVSGNIPMIGDADDGYVVKLSQENGFCPYRSLLATGAVMFERSDFKQKVKKLDDKTRCLLGGRAEHIFAQLETKNTCLPVRRVFPDSGSYILGKDFETAREVRCIVDCGPLGYLSIAAHGHADALALTLFVAGREMLIDPGTYAYHTKKKWRDYFRGTSAHNTIRVDGRDQSVSGGNFMWLQKAEAFCEVWETGDVFDRFTGHHDGFMRLDDPVRHRREIEFLKPEMKFRIIDELECQGSHSIERFWHFSEQCDVISKGDELTVTNTTVQMSMTVREDTCELELFRGNETIPLGWISRGFDVKIPTFTAVWRNRIRGTDKLQTLITIALGEEKI